MTTHIVEKIFCLRLSMTKSAKSFWIFRFLAKPQYDNIFRHCERSRTYPISSLRAGRKTCVAKQAKRSFFRKQAKRSFFSNPQ